MQIVETEVASPSVPGRDLRAVSALRILATNSKSTDLDRDYFDWKKHRGGAADFTDTLRTDLARRMDYIVLVGR